MSLSTLHFDTIPPLSVTARVWVYAIAMCVVCLGATAGLTAAVDPFNSQISRHRFAFDRAEQFRRQNVAQWAAHEIRRDADEAKAAADVVLLGDSRSEEARGS